MLNLKPFQESSIFVKFLLLLFLMVALCCLCIFIAAIITFIRVGGNMESFQQAFSLNASTSTLKLFQVAQTIGLFLLPPFAAAILLEKEGIAFLKLKKVTLLPVGLAIILVITFFPLINWLGGINQSMHLPAFLSEIEKWMHQAELQAADLTQKFLIAHSYGELAINIFIMAALPAIGEELFFRGVIQQYAVKTFKNAHIAIWLTAIFFSAFHLQFFGFFPRMILGAILGYLFLWSGNLWYSIVFHFINNAVAVIAYYLFQTGLITTNPETIATQPSDIWLVIATVPFAIILLRQFYNGSLLKRTSE